MLMSVISSNLFLLLIVNFKIKTMEELTSRLCIGLKTYACTLKSSTHQYFCTTDYITKRLSTNKSHLCLNPLSWQYDTFWTDFFKLQVTYIRGCCEEKLYTNKIVFKKSSHVRVRKVKKLVNNVVPSLNWSVCPIPCTLIIIIILKKVSSSSCYKKMAYIRPLLNIIPHGITVPNQK